jgi:hypothetical protein
MLEIKLTASKEMEAWIRAESERTGKHMSGLIREAISEYAAARGVTLVAELPRTHPQKRRRVRRSDISNIRR